MSSASSVSVTGMVTATPKRLFLKEHRLAKGVSAAKMAKLLGYTREHIYTLEKRADVTKWRVAVEYAVALEISPRRLLSPPGRPSLDEILEDQSNETVKMAADVVARILPRD